MKLLTLNTHSIIEPNYEEKLQYFSDAIFRIKPDIIALQEVNQTINNPSDNHAVRVLNILAEKGVKYNTEWLPIKRGYGKFDEGVAIFSLSPIKEKKAVLLSNCNDYHNWRTRKALGIKVGSEWFYSVHFGWWCEESEAFSMQWERFENNIDKNSKIWVLGDFNCPADIRNEGYDFVMSRGWFDTYTLAKHKDDGFTIAGEIAGWSNNIGKKRIDYILTNKDCDIVSSEIIFNGENEKIVSDHFGILVNI